MLKSAYSHEHRVDGKFVAYNRQGVTCSTSIMIACCHQRQGVKAPSRIEGEFRFHHVSQGRRSGCNNVRQSGGCLRLFFQGEERSIVLVFISRIFGNTKVVEALCRPGNVQ
jgi:hypothetical protein